VLPYRADSQQELQPFAWGWGDGVTYPQLSGFAAVHRRVKATAPLPGRTASSAAKPQHRRWVGAGDTGGQGRPASPLLPHAAAAHVPVDGGAAG